ncbi:transposase [Burkholderia sp. TSV86]|nr:transposase [Burkholderia sp. TSV86]
MTKHHPPYPAEFRQQIVELVKAGRNPSELAREFGCTSTSIQSWVKQNRGDASAPKAAAPLTSAEREELHRLRREVKQLRVERDILGKATAWFAVKGEKIFTPSSNS